jgi:hypothetical protein
VRGGFKDRGGDLVLGRDGFCGIIDEVRLYDRALSTDEVRALYMSGLAYAGGRNVRSISVPPVPKPLAAQPSPAPRNMVPGDSDFESGIDHHWETSAASVDRSTAAHGSACVRLDGSSGGASVETSDITVDVSKPYTFSAFLKGKGKAYLRIITVHPDNPYDATWSKSQSVNLSDSWQRSSLTLEPGWNWTNQWSTVPRSGHKFRAAVRVEKGSMCYVDSTQFEEGKQPTEYAPPAASISISSGKPGNVFLLGEPVHLSFALFAAEPGAMSLRYSAKSCDGEAVVARAEPVKLESAKSARIDAQVPVAAKGLFVVNTELLRNNSVIARSDFTFCAVDPPREVKAEESFFGLQGPCSEDWAEAVRRIGVKWFRLGIGWGWIERKKGEFHWESHDERVKLLRDKGISIMGLVSSTPEWARVETPKGEVRPGSYPPRDMNDLANFMQQAASHFRGRVDHWEIWNESCLTHYFQIPQGYPKSRGEVFSELLKAAYTGAKKGNPACTVAPNPITNKPTPFLEEVLKFAPDAFDILNVHPYTGRVRIGLDNVVTPEQFKMREFMLDAAKLTKEKARGQEVWNSEQGFTLDCDAPPDSPLAMDYANYMARSLLLQRAAPIRRAFWFLSYDQRLSNNRKGMWRHGMQPLPIVAAYANLAHLLDGAKRAKQLDIPRTIRDTVYAFAFEREKGGIVAVWLAEPYLPPPILKFTVPGEMEILDIMGNKSAKAALSQVEVSVQLSDSPVYLVSDSVSWEKLSQVVESGQVQPPALAKIPVTKVSTRIELDGRLKDWPAAPPANSFLAAHDRDKLYLAFNITGTQRAQAGSANLLRLGNCLRLRLTTEGGAAQAAGDYDEFLVGQSFAGPQVYCAHASGGREVGLIPNAEMALRQTDEVATYEVAIPFSAFSALTTMPGKAGTLNLQFYIIKEGKEVPPTEPVTLVLQ